MKNWHTVYVGLGSNLCEPLAQVTQAISELAELEFTKLIKVSPWYQSKAIGPGQQPDYINGVALLSTQLEPLELLDQLQAIETHHHRKRIERWGARTLDLDLLLYDDLSIQHPRLNVPHPRIYERNFVLFPLKNVSPDLRIPQQYAHFDNNARDIDKNSHSISLKQLCIDIGDAGLAKI